MASLKTLKNWIIGCPKDPSDRRIFHSLSLIAFFAWVGLGADGLSSSCYGPEEAFLALGPHKYLSLFVAIITAVTVILISASYSQIIELFPTGGGGYLVASKLLNPTLGMISGCALFIDYVLTIAISIASGADALFSFLPDQWHVYKLGFALFGVLLLTWMNLRGVRESVLPLVPIFLIFVVSHCFVILYAIFGHLDQLPTITHVAINDMKASQMEMGWLGLMFIILRAYSLGAGTFTGIEAVSNGMSILREPKVATCKRTMQYMSLSLAFTVAGLMIAYLIFNVQQAHHKTLNAVLFESITSRWPTPWGESFILVTLVSEALILFVAAQAGFLGGPGVLSNMALDRWFPTRFSLLSDRLVSQNGVMLMGLAALVTLAATHGSVHLLVVLYSINVFITFCLSQAGMVRHWLQVRHKEKKWKRRFVINSLGLLATTFILISVVVLKFNSGGWATLLITGLLVVLAMAIKRHYVHTFKLLNRLDVLVDSALHAAHTSSSPTVAFNPNAKTAAILVNGFNGLGLHTLMGVIRYFGTEFKNFVFIQVGVVDAGNFKGVEEIDRLKESVQKNLQGYISFMNSNGYYAEAHSSVGTEILEELESLAQEVNNRYPVIVFFSGQLVFPEDTLMTQWLHNYTIFSLQRRFYQQLIPIVILPIRV